MYKPVGVLQSEALKEENDSLRCQLDAYRNEVELLKQEQGKNQPMSSEEDSTHSQQLSFLQQALQGMQKVALPVHTQDSPPVIHQMSRVLCYDGCEAAAFSVVSWFYTVNVVYIFLIYTHWAAAYMSAQPNSIHIFKKLPTW